MIFSKLGGYFPQSPSSKSINVLRGYYDWFERSHMESKYLNNFSEIIEIAQNLDNSTTYEDSMQ